MADAPDIGTALSGARALVTGATGFVGSRLVRELLDAGASVTALTPPSGRDTPRLDDIAGAVAWDSADFADVASVRAALERAEPRFVFHLAGAIDMSAAADPARLVEANVTAAASVVAACAGLPGLRLCVNTGSCAEYGDARESTDETSPIEPTSLYGATKAASTIVCRTLAEERGVPLAVLRPYNLFGEHEAPGRLVPHVALSLLDGREVPLTAGEQEKDYLYVGDLARAFLAAAARPEAAAGRVFNIGSGASVTVRRLVEMLAEALGADASLLLFGAVPYRANEMWRQAAVTTLAAEVLGWRPSLALAEGLARTAAWYRDNRGLYER